MGAIYALVIVCAFLAQIIGQVIWFFLVTVPVFIYRLFRPPIPAHQLAAYRIDRDYELTKRRMRDAAGQSWRNLAG